MNDEIGHFLVAFWRFQVLIEYDTMWASFYHSLSVYDNWTNFLSVERDQFSCNPIYKTVISGDVSLEMTEKGFYALKFSSAF